MATQKKAATKAGTRAAKTAGAKSPANKSKKSSPENYTKPELREKIKKEVIAGDKGGRPGQWSARKAQLVTHEYEAEGGGYKKPRTMGRGALAHRRWQAGHSWEDDPPVSS
jgi:hypothetical protein